MLHQQLSESVSHGLSEDFPYPGSSVPVQQTYSALHLLLFQLRILQILPDLSYHEEVEESVLHGHVHLFLRHLSSPVLYQHLLLHLLLYLPGFRFRRIHFRLRPEQNLSLFLPVSV